MGEPGKIKNRRLSGAVILLMIAALLLSNPVWCLTDLLPDLFAWLLIWFVLRTFSDLNDNFTAARRQSLYLLALEFLKLLLWFPLRSSSVSSDKMLAALVFCIGEAVCMVLFFRSFLNGTEELARKADCDSLYRKTEDMRFLCVLFVLVRNICTLLPELTAIPELYIQNVDVSDDGLRSLLQELAASGEILTVICTVLELIVAVIWLVSFLPFLRRLSSDSVLSGFLSVLFRSEDPETHRKRRFSALHMARLCFALGLFFTLDLQIDGMRIVPLCVFPALFAVGCLFLKRFADKPCFRLPVIWGLIAAVILLLAELYRRFFTVWDMLVYAEQGVETELFSSLWMLVCMTVLFCFWLLFAGEIDALSGSLGCGRLQFMGMPYGLLILYALLQSIVFILPLTSRVLTAPRLLFAAAFWVLVNRRLAAFEERAGEVLHLAEREHTE